VPTGYEVQMYRDLERSRQAMESIDKTLKVIADALVDGQQAQEDSAQILGRIARALEHQVFGVTAEEVAATSLMVQAGPVDEPHVE
jgi:hypothetical protein